MAKTELKILSEVGAIKLAEMSENLNTYTEFLKFQGRVFKQNATVALEFFVQSPQVQFIATESQWNRTGYGIKDGSEAICFIGENGEHTDLFDFSQINSDTPPAIWTLTLENAVQVKSAFGIAEEQNLISGLIAQTLNTTQITNSMSALNIPPKSFEAFRKSYITAIQTVIAGRFEIGGNKFSVTSDLTVFRTLDNAQKMHFLSLVSQSARVSLRKVEKTINELNLKEEVNKNDGNDLQAMGKSHGGTTEQHTNERVASNPTAGVAEQSVGVEDGTHRRDTSMANLGQGAGEHETVSRISDENDTGQADLVQVRPAERDVQDEPDEQGNIADGATTREVRRGVADLDESELSALGGGNAVQSQSTDGGEVGGQVGVGVSGDSRRGVHTDESTPNGVRGSGDVGADTPVLQRFDSNEGAGSNPGNTTLDKIEEKLSTIVAKNNEASVEKTDAFFIEKPERRRSDKNDYNQISLFSFDDAQHDLNYKPTRLAPAPIPQSKAEVVEAEQELADNQHIEKIDGVEFVFTASAKVRNNDNFSVEIKFSDKDKAELKEPDTIAEIAYAENPNNKFYDNLSALRELKRIETAIERKQDPFDNRYNKYEDSMFKLARYCGWGGLSQVFDESEKAWSAQRSNLRHVLTHDEYISARETTLNAHYTPQVIIDAMYEAIKNMDLPSRDEVSSSREDRLKSGRSSRVARILEPSCGTGNFIRRLPSELSNAEITGVEIDSITARIAKQLNPNAHIIENGFEHSGLENNDFELVIGNVPFGRYTLNDPDYTQDWLIHDAFFRKAIDKVAPGGVVAFVTSSGTLDKQNPRVREYLAKQAELVGAIRLPNNAFKDAGTKVTADIVFLQKRKTPLMASEKLPEWCYVTPNADGLKINSYFVNNPQMVLGKMEQTTHFDMLTCTPFDSADLKQQLNQAIGNINTKITVEKREKATKGRVGVIEADGRIKNFTFGKHTDGKFYFRVGSKMTEVTGLNAEALGQLGALCELRDVTHRLLTKQKTQMTDEQLMPLRTELNQLYDNYRAKYDVLHSSTVKKIFDKDTDYPLLLGLESKGVQRQADCSTAEPPTPPPLFTKADIFFKRTVNPIAEITGADNIEEALQISIDKRGKPDIPYMAELMGKEAFDVCRELLESELAFRDPDKQILDSPYSGIVERSEYLSGNVRQKLDSAKSNLSVNPDYVLNVKALQKVIPEDIKAENISVRMGVTWIDGEDYTAFMRHLSKRTTHSKNGEVTYFPATGIFEVSSAKIREKGGLNINEHTTYGTADYSLYALTEKILNQRQIVVKYETPHPDEPSKTIIKTNHKATKMALEKARAIKEAFKSWIFADETRRNKYEKKYNNMFNCLVGREYDGSKLTFAGLKSDFAMREHQKNAIARTSMGGNALVTHVVGAGKSAVIFASVMRKKELGLINKACVVVPKALTEQTADEWRKLYPEAKLLTATNDDLSKESNRKLFTARVATGSYDAVILSREQFEKIPMSREFRVKFMHKELDSLENMIRDRKRASGGKKDPTTKNLELAKKRLRAKLEKLTNPKSASKAKDNMLDFEQLGFDYLVVDEAHSYKNGFVMTKMTNVAGVTTRESGRAADMQMKCDYYNEEFGDGHILMATGTPVSNSMTELYVMTRYLRPDLLQQAGISRFDDWAATFGNVTTQLEQTAYDTYKLKTRFSQFANLPELMAFYKEFADIKSAKKLNLPRPALKNGKNTIVNVPATPEQKAYVHELSNRAEAINSGNVAPHEDNFLKITGEARLIGFGNLAVKSLYERNQQELPADFVDVDIKNGKINVCAEKVYETWTQSTENKGVQLVFSDIAVNDDERRFSAYKYLKQELIAKGIPENEIIFAPKSDSKDRADIFKKINAGEYRVVIASTETLGTGANIQQKLVALHHLDIPWKPSDFEQREGRILRQGNMNQEVEIFNYVTEETLDSYLYSTVTNKARFIAQILDDENPARVCEDMDEKVLNYAEIQAIAAGNEDIKERIVTANDLAELHMLKREWGNEQATMRSWIDILPAKLEEKQVLLDCIQADKANATRITNMDELPSAFTNTRILTEINRAISNFKHGDKEPVSIGSIAGPGATTAFDVSVKANEVVRGTLENMTSEIAVSFIVKGEAEYSHSAESCENSNNVVRLKNLFANVISKREETVKADVERISENIEQAQSQIGVAFEHEAKIIELETKLEELDKKLSGITEQEDVLADPEEQPLIETADEKSEREKIYSANDDDFQPVPDSVDPDNDDNPKQSPTKRGR